MNSPLELEPGFITPEIEAQASLVAEPAEVHRGHLPVAEQLAEIRTIQAGKAAHEQLTQTTEPDEKPSLEALKREGQQAQLRMLDHKAFLINTLVEQYRWSGISTEDLEQETRAAVIDFLLECEPRVFSDGVKQFSGALSNSVKRALDKFVGEQAFLIKYPAGWTGLFRQILDKEELLVRELDDNEIISIMGGNGWKYDSSYLSVASMRRNEMRAPVSI